MQISGLFGVRPEEPGGERGDEGGTESQVPWVCLKRTCLASRGREVTERGHPLKPSPVVVPLGKAGRSPTLGRVGVSPR